MKEHDQSRFMQISTDFAYLEDRINSAIKEGELINLREKIMKL